MRGEGYLQFKRERLHGRQSVHMTTVKFGRSNRHRGDPRSISFSSAAVRPARDCAYALEPRAPMVGSETSFAPVPKIRNAFSSYFEGRFTPINRHG